MKAVHQVFENHALQQPERVAIVNGSSKVSYQQLNDHANTLAHALIQLGVGKDVFVGVLMPVGYRYISAMLSIFKANGVYLPLDWNFSAKRFAQVFKTSFSGYLIIDIEQLDRVRAMIAQFDVGLRYLIVLDKDQVCVFNSPKRELNPVKLPIAPKENPGLLPDMEANNYIYYTSGSTGEGKAIVGNHKALSHFIQWEIKEFGLDQSSRISQIAQITFDASLKDILTALCAGGTVCVPTPEEKQNLAMLARWIREQDLTLLQCVPSIFRLITQELRHGNNGKLPVYPKLKQVILAGEMLYAKDVQQWKEVVGDHVAVANLYGATESTILKTFYRINEVPSNLSQIIPVGKPMDDTSVAIINDNHICRVGEKGEIYIKTPFLTNGYYRNEELNSKAFVQNPLVSAKKDIVYKTGDVGRYLRSGDIEVLGRIDDQVKVNGVRVELGEIEGAMVSIQGINKAVVMPYEKSNAQLELVGYYSNATITQDEIRRALSLTLNAELIPTYLIHVDHFPLNINGKVNKKLLPRPDMTGTAMDNKEKPAGETEIQLAEIWKKVLSISEISRINSFFNIGGNSIKALQITSMIYQQFAVNLKLTAIFEYPTIESLAKLIDHSRRESFKSIQAIEEQEHYGLSYGQSRIWALLQLENDEGAYNMHTAFEITGGFNTKVFQRAFHILLQRHESLRTRFVEVEGQPRQKILPLNEGLSKFKVHDLRDSKDSIKLSQEIAVNNARKKFDLGQGPLFRIEIIQQTDQKLILLLAIHHIIADGWSTEILSRELASLYDQGLQGTAVVKPKQRIQYKDYVAWQKELLSDIALSDHRRYWLDQFEGEIPVLQLPTVYPRPAVKTYNGNRMSCLIDPSTSEKIITFCREHELSQYAFFLASINHLMFLYTGETDIIVGSPSSGRNHPDLESQIGFFLNNIPIRTRFDKHTTFQQLVEKIKKLTRDAQDHSDYPFHLLVTELNLKRDLSRSALYDIGFTWHDIAATEEAKGLDFEMARYDTPFVSAKGDLWFHGMNTAKGIVFLIEYNTDLFDQPWMNTFLEHMRKLVCEELENVSRSLNEYNYLSAAEREQLLEFAVTKPVTDASKSFLQAFCETVEICPGDIAVQKGVVKLSYADLDKRSDQLASFMAQEWKLKPNDIVAVMTERSVECVIGLLAIMKAGGAFLPMDASSPANRIAAILHDANVSGILTESQFLFSLPESSTQNILALDVQLDEVSGYAENLESNVDQSNLAYVIYTSGSTGKPKGVAIQQKSFANYLNWANAYYFKNQRGNIFGWFTSLAFDLTLTSIFTTLMRGDKLVICPAMENDDLVRFVFSEENDINTIKLTPSHLGLLSYVPVAKTNIKTVIVGGEKLTREQIASLFAIDKNIVLFNEYGPTETTVGCSVNRVSSVDDHESVGRPIEHTGIFILDENQNLLPVGCSGEICVSGDGVSQGYLRQVELTKQKFVDHALVSAGKLYRTGDKGKWTRDGQLIYQGRLDSQVKIRGYRIELQEIETLLLQHHAVEKVAVLAKALSQDELQLVAFYTSASGTEQDLNGYLKKFLPPYMVPSIFRLMKDFPLNRNGKLDAEKLLKEDLGLKVEGFVEPENELQRKLQTIWQNVLRREPIGINEDFFSLGGESLKAIQLVYHIGRDLGMKIKPSDVFTYTTIGTLAEILEAAAQKDHQPLASMAVEEQDHYPVSHAQKRLWYFDRANSANRHAYHIPTIHYFTGNFSAESFKNAVKAVADRHEALRTVFVQIDDVPRQKIIEPAHFEVPVNIVDLSNHSDKDTAFEAIKRAVENKPFDLRFDALFRMCVVKIDDGDFRVLAAIHHIISDEWSFELLGREIISRYNAIESKEDLVYEKLRVHYKDFAVWQNYTIHGDTGTEVNGRDEHKHYWLNKFASPPALIDLPFAKLRPQVKTFSGQRVNFTLEKQVVDDLKIYCSRSGVSLFMLLFGALKVLIYRYTRETDLVLSTPTVGRDHVDLENMMGNFVNMLAIRTSVNGDHNFETYLRQVKSAMLEAYDHQLYPFDCLLEELHLETDFSRQPLFDIGFTWHTNNITGQPAVSERKETEIQQGFTDFVMAKADMWWHAMDAGNIVGFSVIYSTDLFDQKDMMRFADHYKQLVAGLVRSVNLPIDQLPYLTEAQLQTVLNFGRNEQLFQDQTFITKLFEQQAEKYPEAIALTVEDRSYSYRELNKKVNQLTHVLREKYNIKPGDVVGVIVNRSEWIAISLLAVLKTGAVYLPGDPDNPHERLAYMLQNAKAKALVSQSELLIEIMEFFHSTLVLVDMELSYDEGNFSNPEILVTEQDPAYVIYTSGTSGEPKGVQVSHGSLANLLTGLRQTLNYGEAQHFALMASMSFDASLKQILQPLLLGKHLVIVDQIRNIRKAAATLAEQKVNVLSITPTVLQAVVSELSLRKLPNTFRLICCGGELLDPTFSNQLLDHFPDATLTNIYGPTETTDLAATFAIHSTHEDVVPVGKPLPNCEIFILDEVKQPVPIGNKGEIFIGGKGVSLGYIHDPERTNQKFVTHPFDITKKIYKTGDIGYFGEDGNLRIIGRADDQVKVRGHRIELGEIKNRLIKHPHVQQCAITCIGEGVDKEIVAYVVEKDIVTVRPSWAEQFVYDDMAYYAMGSDQYRNDKYREALSKVVKDKVVLEIGPGSDAVLSLMAIECGAGKVYAVEVLEESYRKAKKKVEMLGWTNRIEVIHGDVTTITLPEKVDCCIADIVGSIGGSQGSATILNASRRLMNAEPKVVPARSISRIAAATLPPENFDYSFDEIGAHYARKIFERVGYTYDIRLSLDNFKLQYLLSTADVFEDLDYRIENNLNDKHEISLEITSPGICHGFIVWLDLFFDDDIKVDTLTDKAQKLWLPIYLPVFPEGAPVTRGDMIKASVSKKLSKNGLHPDYGIEGHLIKDKQQLPFRFDSFNEEKVFKNNVFYERLFETSTQNGNEAMPEAKGLKVYKSLDHQAVIRYLGDHLPHYMLPTHVIKVSGIPTTVNGKVNFKALPAPEERIVDLRNPADRSLDPVEEKLLNIWKDVLRRESIMPDDSFFSIGGHSLRAAQLIARIHMEFKIEFDLKDVFDHPTIGEMAIKIKSMKSRDIEHILPVEEQDHYRVSHAQKRLWLLQQADKNLTAYNNPIALELSGVFDIDAFGKAYQMLLSRHEIMRSVFITVAAEPRQKIHQPEKKIYEVEWIDYTDGKHRTADIDKVVRAFTDTPFDLSNGPLAKTAVIKLSENRFVWLFSMHHIISDAWSLGVLMDELLTYYKTYANGLEPETRSLRIQYKDFTAWQYNQLQSRAELKSYWAQQFEEIPEQLSLPTDFSRTRSITFAGDHVTVDLDVQVSAGLRQYTTDRGSSLFITLTSAVATLLYKYTGQTDIIVGTNVAGRDHQDLENQIGFYLNTLPIRIRIDENAAFSSLHDRVKRETFDAFAHQLYPYDQLISDLSTRGLDTSQPLFNVEVELIHVNMGNQSDVELSGVKTRRYENNFSISKDDLSFRFIENDAKLTLSIGYKTDLFEKETIERMMQRFVQVVSAILENDSIPLAEINYLTEAERQQMTIALDAQG